MDEQGASRNAPCPCGSGKKYKRCCGKVGGGYRRPAPGSRPASIPRPLDLVPVPCPRCEAPVRGYRRRGLPYGAEVHPCGCLLDEDKLAQLSSALLAANPQLRPLLVGKLEESYRATIEESRMVKALPNGESFNRCPVCGEEDDDDLLFPVIGYGYEKLDLDSGPANWVGIKSIRCGHSFKVRLSRANGLVR